MSTEDKEISGHDYDGIKEFDNPLPMWWLVTLFGTIIFAFLYFIHYEFGGGPSLAQELATGLKQMQALNKPSNSAPSSDETEEMIARAGGSPDALKQAQQNFDTKCVSCHGPQMQGLIGPNLTDSYWIHGKGKHVDIVQVIRTGVADKGMPPWGPLLKKEEIYGLAALIVSKKGSNPANPKPPQGEKVE